jgi:arylsulfatase A-like enzyme
MLAPRAIGAENPNVGLILIDDLNHYGVTAYGADRMSEMTGLFKNVKISTPSIDALARTGLRCDNELRSIRWQDADG